MLIIFEVV